ncbi:hypothetical protein DFQ28_001884, partial [Apophysomyces sp. BC1034]
DSNEPIATHNLSRWNDIINQLKDIQGTTQDLLAHLKVTTKPMCLFVLDYVGLSTNYDDIYEFISEQTKIKRLAVDRIPATGEIVMFTREEIMAQPSTLKDFDCRKAPVQRSI